MRRCRYPAQTSKHRQTADRVKGHPARAKRNNPGSVILAHPECPKNILEVSDVVGGTEKMRRHVQSVTEPTKFLVATEPAMIHAFQKVAPQHEYIPVPGIMANTGETCACNRCPHMARNTLQKVRDCLRDERPEIEWQPYFSQAREVLQRQMVNLGRQAVRID